MSKVLKFGFCMAIGVILCGCGAKSPAQLSGEQITINNSLLEKRYSFVPKDPYLSNQNYAYSMVLKPDGKYLIENDLVVKTFLLAHSSQKITLIGGKELIQKYKEYFLSNGVNAEIYLQPLETNENINTLNELESVIGDSVQIIFFNKRV